MIGIHMQDGNMGLLQLALEAHTMRTVQRLTRTYMTLSLSDIAGAAQLKGPQEAETLVLRYNLTASRFQAACKTTSKDNGICFGGRRAAESCQMEMSFKSIASQCRQTLANNFS